MAGADGKKARRKVDPVGARKAIVEAAVVEFGAKGFDATTMDAIAKRAGVTKSLVQYHFETKDSLWQTTLLSCLGPFMEAVDRFLESEGTAEDMVQLLRRRIETFTSRPEAARLIAWAALDPTRLPAPARDRGPRIWTRFAGDGHDVRRRRMMVGFAAVDGWILMRNVYGAVLGQDADSLEFREAFLAEVERLVMDREVSRETKS